jgi:hypothetical protein
MLKAVTLLCIHTRRNVVWNWNYATSLLKGRHLPTRNFCQYAIQRTNYHWIADTQCNLKVYMTLIVAMRSQAPLTRQGVEKVTFNAFGGYL